MKAVRLTQHAKEQCQERGATKEEVIQVIENGLWKSAKHDRKQTSFNFHYGKQWSERFYSIKQVVPIFKEEQNEIVVITVYTFYF